MAGVTAAVVAGVGVAATVGGTIASAKMSADAQKKASRAKMGAAAQAAEEYNALDAPSIADQMLELERIKSAGNLTPEQEAIVEKQESDLKAIQIKPELRDVQMGALEKLQQTGREGGFSPIEKAQMNQIQNQVSNQNASNRNAVLQSYAQRGMAGSGLEQAAQLMGSQAASGTAADQGFNVASEGYKRALDSIIAGGTLGGKMEAQQFSQDAQIAQAGDVMKQFDAKNRQDAYTRQADRTNYANERNLNNEQAIANANVGLANQQQITNKGLYQQDFNNQLQLAQGKANALNSVGNAAQSSADATSANLGAMGQAIGTVGSGLMNFGLGKFGQKDDPKKA